MERYGKLKAEHLHKVIQKAAHQGATQYILMWTGTVAKEIINQWDKYLNWTTRNETPKQTKSADPKPKPI
jgi:hypothetical protein